MTCQSQNGDVEDAEWSLPSWSHHIIINPAVSVRWHVTPPPLLSPLSSSLSVASLVCLCAGYHALAHSFSFESWVFSIFVKRQIYQPSVSILYYSSFRLQLVQVQGRARCTWLSRHSWSFSRLQQFCDKQGRPWSSHRRLRCEYKTNL